MFRESGTQPKGRKKEVLWFLKNSVHYTNITLKWVLPRFLANKLLKIVFCYCCCGHFRLGKKIRAESPEQKQKYSESFLRLEFCWDSVSIFWTASKITHSDVFKKYTLGEMDCTFRTVIKPMLSSLVYAVQTWGLLIELLAAEGEAPHLKATFVFLFPLRDLLEDFGLSAPQLTWVT